MHSATNMNAKRVFLILCIFITNCQSFKLNDICKDLNGKKVFVDYGEKGQVFAKNVNLNIGNLQNNYISHQECIIEIVTCPSCIINLKFTHIKLLKNCGNNSVLDGCSCDYVWVYEPPFQEVSGKQFCGFSEYILPYYESLTNTIAIVLMLTKDHEHAFTIEYQSTQNRKIIQNNFNSSDNSLKFLSSPFFPQLYPRNIIVEYVLNCSVSNVFCRVSLAFTDFQISTSSFIEIFDWNGQRLFVTNGLLFRPPILLSSGPTMVVRFYGNGGSNIGYKARYNFLNEVNYNLLVNTDGNCGGYVADLGGGITMLQVVKKGVKFFDCYWIIKPPPSFIHLKTHLYLKIIDFKNFGNTELVIRQGTTSIEPVLDVLRYPVPSFVQTLSKKEYTVPISQGFYVSLKGSFNVNSSLAIMYSAFNYKECYSYNDFLCQNHRCISAYLICDGYDHCGDNSDEYTNCKKSATLGKWAHRSNFYFPKLDKDNDLRVATLIFIVCSLGLLALIFAMVSLLYRVNSRTSQMQIQTHIQTINDLLEESISSPTDEEVLIDDIPPLYEDPPTYDDVIKNIVYSHRGLFISNKTEFLEKLCGNPKSFDESLSDFGECSTNNLHSQQNLVANSPQTQDFNSLDSKNNSWDKDMRRLWNGKRKIKSRQYVSLSDSELDNKRYRYRRQLKRFQSLN